MHVDIYELYSFPKGSKTFIVIKIPFIDMSHAFSQRN